MYDCFKMFTEEEFLQGDDKAYCSKCKDHCNATKKLVFYRVPNVLVLHLKRFSIQGEKLVNEIAYPLENLDISQYIDSEALKAAYSTNGPLYKLTGIVQHFGSVGGGHYKNMGLREVPNEPAAWYSYNDSTAKRASEPSAKSASQAYILFYVKQ